MGASLSWLLAMVCAALVFVCSEGESGSGARTIVPQQGQRVRQTGRACGRSFPGTARIIGGQQAAFGSNPWQAALMMRGRTDEGPFCGGSLIHPNYVLTAARCVEWKSPSNMFVRLGEHDWTNDKEWPPHRDFPIKKVILYENSSFPRQDVALIELTRAVRLSEHIDVICLPPKDTRFNVERATGKVSGWGAQHEHDEYYTVTLREVCVPILGYRDCRKAWLPHPNQPRIHSTNICAGYPIGGKDFCHEDTGGPLTVLWNREAVLIGVASHNLCGQRNAPGVYISVSAFLEWIESYTGQSDCWSTS